MGRSFETVVVDHWLFFIISFIHSFIYNPPLPFEWMSESQRLQSTINKDWVYRGLPLPNEILLLLERVVPGSALAEAQGEETSHCSMRKHPTATVNKLPTPTGCLNTWSQHMQTFVSYGSVLFDTHFLPPPKCLLLFILSLERGGPVLCRVHRA